MPIYFVRDDVLDVRSKCILNPFKADKMYMFDGINKKIFEKAGEDLVIRQFDFSDVILPNKAFLNDGLSVSEKLIHVIMMDLTNRLEYFRLDLFMAYNSTFKLIIQNKFTDVIFTPIGYGLKRMGSKESLKTALYFLDYYINAYKLDINFFVLTDSRTMDDVINDYTPTYISTSYPPSKQHEETKFPFPDKDIFTSYMRNKRDKIFKRYIGKPLVVPELKNKKFELLYNKIKDKYREDRMFCISANISTKEYIKNIEKEDYTPERNVILSMCIALKLTLAQINKVLKHYSYDELDNSRPNDEIIMDYIKDKKYNVTAINQQLYIKELSQLGSFSKSYISNKVAV